VRIASQTHDVPDRELLHSGRSTKSTSPANGLRRASDSANPFSVRKPQGQRSPTTTVPRSSEERAGTSATAEAGQRVAIWQTRHTCTRRDQLTLKGNEPQPAASPRPPPSRSSRHRMRNTNRRAGHAGAIADVRQKSWPTRTRTPATAFAQAKFKLLMLNSGSEIRG
jgi:hypothetical protein